MASSEPIPIVFANPEGVPPPVARYSHVAVIPAGARLLAVAGQVGIAEDGSLPQRVEDQYRNALTHIVRILASQGVTPAGIVKLNTWLVGEADLAEIARIRAEVLGPVAPASTLAWVPRLFTPEYRVEIEAWAADPA